MPLYSDPVHFSSSTSSHDIAAVVVVVIAVIVIIIIVAVVVAVIVVVVVVVVVDVVVGVWFRRVRELGGLIGASQCRVIAETGLALSSSCWAIHRDRLH